MRWRSRAKSPIYSLVAKPEISSFVQLKGKVLGLSLPANTIWISIRKLLALKGLNATDYSVKEPVSTPVRLECLRRGECDAVPLGQPESGKDARVVSRWLARYRRSRLHGRGQSLRHRPDQRHLHPGWPAHCASRDRGGRRRRSGVCASRTGPPAID